MKNFLHINDIAGIHKLLGDKPKHPLVTAIDFSKIDNHPEELPKIVINFYGVIYVHNSNCTWKYGRNKYDFQEGTLVFISPSQVLEVEVDRSSKKKNGWGLFFHPDLLLGTNLRPDSSEYSFFSYDVSEALHISDREKGTLIEVRKKIEEEIAQNIDRHSRRLIVSNIELLLNYCIRFYDRQFITRSHKSNDLISQFEQLLKNYFNSEALAEQGIPTVTYCAKQMNLSTNYLSDLLKKETGKSTLEHIHFQLIHKAKYLLLNSDNPIREIAFQLGFEYPQYFNKLFKRNVGMSPKKFRTMN